MAPRNETSIMSTFTSERVELHPHAPYDFAWALTYLRTSPSAVLEEVSADGWYTRALTLGKQDVVLRLRSVGSVARPRLALDVWGTAVDQHTMAAAERQVRRVFLLDDDPGPFHAMAAGDSVLGGLVEQFPGMRPILIATPYEALTWAIIGQQISVGFARKLKQTLVQLCGRSVTIGERVYPMLPRPDDVAALNPVLLRAHSFSQQKAAYLVRISQAIVTGELDLPALTSLPFDDAVAALTRFKGIGRWTAEYVLMRGLGTRDSIPAADLGLRAIMGRAYGLGRHATEAEVRAYAEQWVGWRSWAAFTWWLALQLESQR